LVITDTSSNNDAISSNKVNNELNAIFFPCIKTKQISAYCGEEGDGKSTGIYESAVKNEGDFDRTFGGMGYIFIGEQIAMMKNNLFF